MTSIGQRLLDQGRSQDEVKTILSYFYAFVQNFNIVAGYPPTDAKLGDPHSRLQPKTDLTLGLSSVGET